MLCAAAGPLAGVVLTALAPAEIALPSPATLGPVGAGTLPAWPCTTSASELPVTALVSKIPPTPSIPNATA